MTRLKLGDKLVDDRHQTTLFIEIIDVAGDKIKIRATHWAASFDTWTNQQRLLTKARLENWTPQDVKESMPYSRARKYG